MRFLLVVDCRACVEDVTFGHGAIESARGPSTVEAKRVLARRPGILTANRVET